MKFEAILRRNFDGDLYLEDPNVYSIDKRIIPIMISDELFPCIKKGRYKKVLMTYGNNIDISSLSYDTWCYIERNNDDGGLCFKLQQPFINIDGVLVYDDILVKRYTTPYMEFPIWSMLFRDIKKGEKVPIYFKIEVLDTIKNTSENKIHNMLL